MTVSAGEVSVKVSADTSGLGRQIKTGADNEISGAGMGGLGKKLGGLIMAGVSIAGIAEIFKTGFDEAKDASANIAQLNAGMISTGNAANVSIKGMSDLASEIQNYSGQTDDSIMKTESLLQTFTNIRNVGPDKIFDDTTRAAADMAAKLGGDATQQAMLLGKALNDPAHGLVALRKNGVSFTESQIESIKAMQASGDMMGAQKAILSELSKEFGGAAKAAGQSFPGQLEILKRQFEDMAQGLMDGLIPAIQSMMPTISDALKTLSPVLAQVGQALGPVLGSAMKALMPIVLELAKVLGPILTTVGAALQPIIGKLGEMFTKVWAALSPLLPVLMRLFDALLPLITPLLDLVLAILPPLIDLFVTILTPIIDLVTWLVQFLTPAIKVIIDVISWLINNVIKVLKIEFEIIGAAIKWVWENLIKPVFDKWAEVFNWIWVNVLKPIGDLIGLAFKALGMELDFIWKNVIQPVFQAFGAAFNWIWTYVIKPVVDFINGAIKTVGDTVSAVFGGIGRFIGSIFSGIQAIFKGAINGIIDFVNGAMDIINPIIDGPVGDAARGMGINIRHLTHIRHLAEGGIVPAQPGGQIVRVAEAGEAEAVIPLSKLDGMTGKGMTVQYYAAPNASIDAQADLFTAMRRAKLLAGW